MLSIKGCHCINLAHLYPLSYVPLTGLHGLARLRNGACMVRGRRYLLAFNSSIVSSSSRSHRCILLNRLIRVGGADEFLPDASPSFRPTLRVTVVVDGNAAHDLIEVLMVPHATTWRVIVDAWQLTARSLRQVKRLSQFVVERFEPFLSWNSVIQAEVPTALSQALLISG